MQRRKVESTPSKGNGDPLAQQQPQLAPPPVPSTPLVRRNRRNNRSDSLSLLLLVIVVLVGAISIISPGTVRKAEQKAADTTKVLVHDAYVAEQQVEGWLHNQQQLPPERAVVDESKQESIDASEAMKRQPSSWVDGEKKLKKKLKELVARQAEGKDLSVPILTRWLGDDIPAWLSEGEDKEAWEKKRDERYEQMRKEEEQWRAKVREYITTDGEIDSEGDTP